MKKLAKLPDSFLPKRVEEKGNFFLGCVRKRQVCVYDDTRRFHLEWNYCFRLRKSRVFNLSLRYSFFFIRLFFIFNHLTLSLSRARVSLFLTLRRYLFFHSYVFLHRLRCFNYMLLCSTYSILCLCILYCRTCTYYVFLCKRFVIRSSISCIHTRCILFGRSSGSSAVPLLYALA